MAEIKVLLADDKPEERAALRRVLAATGLDLARIEESGAGSDAHSLAQELEPDVILIAFEEPVARALKAIEALANLKSSQVVAVSSLGDREYLRKAMRAGAREYLVKPVKPGELARAIQAVLDEETRRKALAETGTMLGDVFTVMGPKGGTGKTSLATNLAASLALQTRQRVAIVDLALQMGDVAMMLDVVPERTIADLANLGGPLEPELLEGFLSSHPSGLKVLAAASEFDPDGLPSAPMVRRIVEGLARTYDYVVIDGDHFLAPPLWAALELSTVVFVVTSADTASMKNARQTLEILRAQGYADDKVKLVLNHPYRRNGVPVEELSKLLNYPVFWKIPHDDACGQCINLGKPFVQARPKAKISQNVAQLARTMGRVETKRRGLLGRMANKK